MRIALIGTGNVAWHLAEASIAAGHQLVAVAGRTAEAAEAFAKKHTGTLHGTQDVLSDLNLDLVLIAVPDAQIAAVAEGLQVQPGTVVAHTSGSQPIDLLNSIEGAAKGVFYPVQTFTKYKPIDFSKIPVLIEGNTLETEQLLQHFAQTLSNNVQVKDSDTRRQLHLAAVFACNFTNHLFGISQAILNGAQLPTNLLEPLIQETIAKAKTNDPFTVQTGPAVRNDINVLDAHVSMLQTNPNWQEVYKSITQSIKEQQNRKQDNQS